MEIVRYIVMGIYLVVCVALMVLTFKQTKEEGGTSTIMGAAASNFYEKNKGKSREGKMKKATIVLLIVYAVLTVALGIIYVA